MDSEDSGPAGRRGQSLPGLPPKLQRWDFAGGDHGLRPHSPSCVSFLFTPHCRRKGGGGGLFPPPWETEAHGAKRATPGSGSRTRTSESWHPSQDTPIIPCELALTGATQRQTQHSEPKPHLHANALQLVKGVEGARENRRKQDVPTTSSQVQTDTQRLVVAKTSGFYPVLRSPGHTSALVPNPAGSPTPTRPGSP